MKNLKPR